MTRQMRECGPAVKSGHADSSEALGEALLRLVWQEQKRLAHQLAAHSLTVPQFLVLTSIAQQDSGCAMGALAGQMLQSSATMTGIVERLVRTGLVQRLPAAHDRRVVVVALTESGEAVLLRLRQEKRAWLEQALAQMSEDDRVTFVRLIRAYLAASDSIGMV